MTNNTSTPAPQFTDAAVALWNLQNEADAARGLATMGERVSPARYVLRQSQAVAAQEAYIDAMAAADEATVADYAALLRFRATL